MRDAPEMEVRRDPRGYYTLTVNGRFAGNFETVTEAVIEYETLYENGA